MIMDIKRFIPVIFAAVVLAGCHEKIKPDDPEPEPTYGYGLDVATPRWLELPATKKGDGKEWFAHDMEGGDYFAKSGAERNWSFYYDYASYVSSWVAYPLNRDLMGSGSRSDQWGYDPLIPYTLQQNIVSSAYGTGHSRGHQIPSADRLATRAANVSTFYATNITPQDSNFNGGIWEKLESKVRTFAKACDTLYVVTGCVVKDTTPFIKDKMNHAVKVPEGYYKALLRYKKGASDGEYIACGFYYPHDSSLPADSFMDYKMSINELEEKTGMDFFVYLADKVGPEKARTIKSQEPSNWWK